MKKLKVTKHEIDLLKDDLFDAITNICKQYNDEVINPQKPNQNENKQRNPKL